MTCAVAAAVALVAFSPDVPSGPTVVRLHVRAMPAPRPALKYQLLPEQRELRSGNPAQNYLKCFAEQRNFFYSKEGVAQRERYLAMPLADLPATELRQFGGNALRQADWAARLDTLDWEALPHIQNEGQDAVLPEIAPLRVLAAALQVRFRGQVAGRHYDDAIRTAKTMFQLARHLGEHPTLAANLVGLSVAHRALDALEEMEQQSDCPNLYWALTDLPCPLVDLRKGAQGDRAQVAADLRPIRDDAAMTEAQIEQVVSRLNGLLGTIRIQAGRPPRTLRTPLEARVKDDDRVRAARGRLVQAGCAESLVKAFPPAQVILLDEKRDYEIRRDEGLKLLGLAPWQIDALLAGENSPPGSDGLFVDLLPHIVEVRRAQGRLEQRIALVRHVEALRLYVAEHDGKLPEKLSDVPMPLPSDPFTGKPFDCTIESATAHLRGSPPRGEEQNPRYNVRYEVTIQK
jgi:hypothetical protein